MTYHNLPSNTGKIDISDLNKAGFFDKDCPVELGSTGTKSFTAGPSRIDLTFVKKLDNDPDIETEEIHVMLEYIPPRSKNKKREFHGLETTRCHFGGKRWWFICWKKDENDERCNRRSRILYYHNGRFQCRKCANIRYETQISWWARSNLAHDIRIEKKINELAPDIDFEKKTPRDKYEEYFELIMKIKGNYK